MRCRSCNYPLWNLSARNCPECGDPFYPSEYQFKPNSVEFRCPHCAQTYYGTSPEGHLVPRTFACVQCNTMIGMDSMVLVAAPGVDPENVIPEHMPWIRRAHTGRRKAWWKTSILGMINPVLLARVTPENAGLGAAWKFTIVNVSLVLVLPYLLLAGVIVLFGLITALGGGGAPGGGLAFLLMLLGTYALFFLALIIIQLIFVAIWIPVTHAFLRITGSVQHPMRATSLSILYTSGANLPNIIPCVNYISWLWWPITAGIMLKDMQGVSAWRSVIATLLAPALAVGAFVIAYAAFFAWAMSLQATAMNAGMANASSSLQASTTWRALDNYVGAAGAFPEHALHAIAAGDMDPDDVIHPHTMTVLSDIPVGDITLNEFEYLSVERQLQLARDASDALPDDVTAHRLGDVVFTHHGLTPNAHFNLWIAIISPDPDANPGQTDIDAMIWVCLASGAVDEHLSEDFEWALDLQNRLRAEYGLDPLPHPSTIRHDAPARANP